MMMTTSERTTYELADIKTRFAALCIDCVILFCIEHSEIFNLPEVDLTSGFIMGLVYMWFFLTRNQGQTPGKSLMNIRVIKMDGSPINDWDAVIRYIGYFVNNHIIFGWLWAFFDENNQGLHDKIVKTYVVKTS